MSKFLPMSCFVLGSIFSIRCYFQSTQFPIQCFVLIAVFLFDLLSRSGFFHLTLCLIRHQLIKCLVRWHILPSTFFTLMFCLWIVMTYLIFDIFWICWGLGSLLQGRDSNPVPLELIGHRISNKFIHWGFSSSVY